MAKSLKSLRKGATRRSALKNPDGSPIHYDQRDEVPVFEGAGRVAHDVLKNWKHHANTIKAYIEDHGTHYEAHHQAGGLLGRFDSHPDGEGRGHGYIDHPVGRVSEAVESLEQLYPIFEQAGLFEAGAQHGYAAGQHGTHFHADILHHTQEMAKHIAAHKAAPSNMAHMAKASDHEEHIQKKHGHEAARYAKMAAHAFASGNERGGHATVNGAHRHALAHHGLLPEALAPARAKEAQSKAGYEAGLAATASKAGFKQGAAKHEKRYSRYAKLLTKEDWANSSRRLKDNLSVKAMLVPPNPATVKKNKEHPVHNKAVASRLPPLQSNGGLKKWRKKNGGPGHVEKGPIKTDNVIENKTINDLPSYSHMGVGHAVTSAIAHHAKTKGGYPDREQTQRIRQTVINNFHKKMKANGQIKEAKVPDWLKSAARDSLQKQGYKVDMQLRTAKKPKKVKPFRDAAVTGDPRDFAKEEFILEASPEYQKWKTEMTAKHGALRFATKPLHTPEGWNYTSQAHKGDEHVGTFVHSHRAAVLAGKHGEAARQKALAAEEKLYEGKISAHHEYKDVDSWKAEASKRGYHTQMEPHPVHQWKHFAYDKEGNVRGNYSQKWKVGYLPKAIKEEINEDSKKEMKRKYLGKSKGRTKLGTKAHPIDTEPKLVLKDSPVGRAQSRMPTPTASKGI